MGNYSKGTRYYDEDLEKKIAAAEEELLKDIEKMNEECLSALEGWECSEEFKRMQLISDVAAATGNNPWALECLTNDELRRLMTPQEKVKYSFRSKLGKREIEILLPVANEVVFSEQQTAESMLEWLACEHKEPIRVKKNYLAAYMMYLLAKDGWICANWQKVAEEMKVFGNKTTLTQKNISKCLTEATRRYGGHFVGDVILNEKIYDSVKRLKR